MKLLKEEKRLEVSGGNPVAVAAVVIAAATYGYTRGKNRAERDNRTGDLMCTY